MLIYLKLLPLTAGRAELLVLAILRATLYA
jgi:hypothetical protein